MCHSNSEAWRNPRRKQQRICRHWYAEVRGRRSANQQKQALERTFDKREDDSNKP